MRERSYSLQSYANERIISVGLLRHANENHAHNYLSGDWFSENATQELRIIRIELRRINRP
jgi:hypothetical protein